MLLGNVLTLGHELDIFDSKDNSSDLAISTTGLSFQEYLLLRRRRVKRVLFVYISQLASRIGCTIPKTPFHDTILSVMDKPDSMLDRQWHTHMTSWIELSRLIRTSSEFLFPSKAVTRELLQSGRYREFLNHFQPLLKRWLASYLQEPCKGPGVHGIRNSQLNIDYSAAPPPYHRLLMIDYHFVCLYINSLALQAVARRNNRIRHSSTGSHLKGTQDFNYIREVINNSKHILEIVMQLAGENQLKYIPVRMFIRIASASIYLVNVSTRVPFYPINYYER